MDTEHNSIIGREIKQLLVKAYPSISVRDVYETTTKCCKNKVQQASKTKDVQQ